MAETARMQGLRRAVGLQAALRDDARAGRAALAAREADLHAQEAAVLRTLEGDTDGALRVLMLAGASRQLDRLARERASLQAQMTAIDTRAAEHARLARAGERRLDALTRAWRAERERQDLAALIERYGGPASPA